MKEHTSFHSVSYRMEELAPVFSRVAARYAGPESTSLSYEKARQLMGSILYCIREYEQAYPNAVAAGPERAEAGNKAPAGSQHAEAAYRAGLRLVNEKVQDLLTLYHTLLPDFETFGLRCLEDTFLKGIPEFFKWYDPEYAAQDTLLTLDYPVLMDLHELSGVDAVYKYVHCLALEQRFLKMLPSNFIQEALYRYSDTYTGLFESLCTMILPSLLKCAPFSEHTPLSEIPGMDHELAAYLTLELANLECRIRNTSSAKR